MKLGNGPRLGRSGARLKALQLSPDTEWWISLELQTAQAAWQSNTARTDSVQELARASSDQTALWPLSWLAWPQPQPHCPEPEPSHQGGPRAVASHASNSWHCFQVGLAYSCQWHSLSDAAQMAVIQSFWGRIQGSVLGHGEKEDPLGEPEAMGYTASGLPHPHLNTIKYLPGCFC